MQLDPGRYLAAETKASQLGKTVHLIPWSTICVGETIRRDSSNLTEFRAGLFVCVTNRNSIIKFRSDSHMHDFDPLDPAYVQDVLSKPPFVAIPGVINVRDLGHYPSTTDPGFITKSGYLFRSAELSGITDEGSWFYLGSPSLSYLLFSQARLP